MICREYRNDEEENRERRMVMKAIAARFDLDDLPVYIPDEAGVRQFHCALNDLSKEDVKAECRIDPHGFTGEIILSSTEAHACREQLIEMAEKYGAAAEEREDTLFCLRFDRLVRCAYRICEH